MLFDVGRLLRITINLVALIIEGPLQSSVMTYTFFTMAAAAGPNTHSAAVVAAAVKPVDVDHCICLARRQHLVRPTLRKSQRNAGGK
eukprot:scaffold329826_cov51-Prasinocladus_malaysianus.AAC.1